MATVVAEPRRASSASERPRAASVRPSVVRVRKRELRGIRQDAVVGSRGISSDIEQRDSGDETDARFATDEPLVSGADGKSDSDPCGPFRVALDVTFNLKPERRGGHRVKTPARPWIPVEK